MERETDYLGINWYSNSYPIPRATVWRERENNFLVLAFTQIAKERNLSLAQKMRMDRGVWLEFPFTHPWVSLLFAKIQLWLNDFANAKLRRCLNLWV